MTENLAHPYNRSRVFAINDLPDDDLLAIFDFCVFRHQYPGSLLSDKFGIKRKIESWQSLVHVCRRWRCLVFGSARRLNLQIFCDATITARKSSLDVWPALPLIVLGHVDRFEASVDRFIAEFKHSDRICQIELGCSVLIHTEKIWTAMQVPFPELVALRLSLAGWFDRALPDSFLGGSAPRLRHLALVALPFPGLPNLLLSATHLVYLGLFHIPSSGYISPEAMANCLSVLTSLEELYFHHFEPSPEQESRRPLTPARSVLPALTNFGFKGANKYFEDFVSRIDTPRLHRLSIMFFDNKVDHPVLNQFISRTPRFWASNEARLILDNDGALVRLSQLDHGMVEVKIFCREPFLLFLSLVQICNLALHPFLTMDNLYFEGGQFSLLLTNSIENSGWLDLLLPFTAVENLYLSETFWPRIVPALQELTGGRTTEVLPALQNVLLEGFQPSEAVQEGIAEFISARQLTNHPVAISVWDRD